MQLERRVVQVASNKHAGKVRRKHQPRGTKIHHPRQPEKSVFPVERYTSMLQRWEQPATTKLLSPNGNLKNQFPQSYGKLACCGSKNSQPQQSYFHQTGNPKNQFPQSYGKLACCGKREQPATTKLLSSNGNPKNQFLQSYRNKQAARAGIHHAYLRYLHQVATRKTSFPSRTRTSMLQEQEYTTHNAVIYAKQQPGKLISQVVQEQACHGDKKTPRVML